MLAQSDFTGSKSEKQPGGNGEYSMSLEGTLRGAFRLLGMEVLGYSRFVFWIVGARESAGRGIL
jgi:hypothetical protein